MEATREKPESPLNLREAASRVSAKDNPDSPLWKEKKLDTAAIRKSGQEMILTDRLDVHGTEDEKGRVYVGPQQVGKENWTFPEKEQPGQAPVKPKQEAFKDLFGGSLKVGSGESEPRVDPRGIDADMKFSGALDSHYPVPTKSVAAQTMETAQPVLRKEFKEFFPGWRFEERKYLPTDKRKIWTQAAAAILNSIEKNEIFRRAQIKERRRDMLENWEKYKTQYTKREGAKTAIAKAENFVGLLKKLEKRKQEGAPGAIAVTAEQLKEVKNWAPRFFSKNTIKQKDEGGTTTTGTLYGLSDAHDVKDVAKEAKKVIEGFREKYKITESINIAPMQSAGRREAESVAPTDQRLGAGQWQSEGTPDKKTVELVKKFNGMNREQALAYSKTLPKEDQDRILAYHNWRDKGGAAVSQGKE